MYNLWKIDLNIKLRAIFSGMAGNTKCLLYRAILLLFWMFNMSAAGTMAVFTPDINMIRRFLNRDKTTCRTEADGCGRSNIPGRFRVPQLLKCDMREHAWFLSMTSIHLYGMFYRQQFPRIAVQFFVSGEMLPTKSSAAIIS